MMKLKMMLATLLIVVLFVFTQVTFEEPIENEKEQAHERAQAGGAPEGEGKTGSLLSREPDAGLHHRTPGSRPELKAGTQRTESPMCFTENVTKYHVIIAVFGILILILLGLFIYKYYYKKNDNKNGLLNGYSEDHQEENGLQQEIARRKAQYKSAWRKALLYADWRKEEFQAVNVTLDEATAHPSLLLSENRRQVTWQESHQDLPSSTQRFDSLPCVLGQPSISSGRSFWEVKVEDAPSWDLGICQNNVTRKGRVTVSPQNGFWAIRFCKGDYWALTSPETCLTVGEKPRSVGIFLDYEDGDVSFYNMTDGTHIFSFPENTFSGALRPLFRLWSSDPGQLTICSSGGEQYNVINMPEWEK